MKENLEALQQDSDDRFQRALEESLQTQMKWEEEQREKDRVTYARFQSKKLCPMFEHNKFNQYLRFNITFKARSDVYHYRLTLLKVLKDLKSVNKLHKAVIVDI